MTNDTDRASYRIMDASFNRASEGLRTLEEYARFVLEDADTTARLKSIRHQLASEIGLLPRAVLLRSRDTPGDVGTEISTESEQQRSSIQDVVAAAAMRTQQALRCLEEYGKTIDRALAAKIERIRYETYCVCSELELSLIGHDHTAVLLSARIYVLIDAGPSEDAFVKLVRTLATGGVDILQLRDSAVADRTLYQRARIGAKIARDSGVLFIMNDRADLAAAANTDGVHVGQQELPPAAARRIVGTDKLVGVSTHCIEQVHQAIADGADYIGCGPTFPGNTKSFDDYPGTEFLREIADKKIEIPWFAIGGVTAANLSQVIAAGCQRIAVTGAVRDSDDPVAAIEKLKNGLKEAAAR